jgi:hypothetical protein
MATLDLDAVAHEVMAPGGAAYDDVVAVRDMFGTQHLVEDHGATGSVAWATALPVANSFDRDDPIPVAFDDVAVRITRTR